MFNSFSPTHRTNQRPARCNRCKAQLPAGAGQGWQFQAESLVNSPVVYLCADCAQKTTAEERALTESREAMAIIGRALRFDRPLGFVDEDRVRRAIRQAGQRAPELAREIAGRIEVGESFTVWQIVEIIQEGL